MADFIITGIEHLSLDWAMSDRNSEFRLKFVVTETGCTVGVRFPTGTQRPHRIWGPLILILVYNGYRELFPGIERPGSEAHHSPPPNAEVKKGGAIPQLPHTS
jgi:hypothetical protein